MLHTRPKIDPIVLHGSDVVSYLASTDGIPSSAKTVVYKQIQNLKQNVDSSFDDSAISNGWLPLPFTNTFDAIHAWTYFLVPWAFAELIVRCLPDMKNVSNESNHNYSSGTTILGDGADDSGTTAPRNDVESQGSQEAAAQSTVVYSFRRLNLLGVGVAVFALLATGIIYITGLAGVNTVTMV